MSLITAIPTIWAFSVWHKPENPIILRLLPRVISYAASSFICVFWTVFFINLDSLREMQSQEGGSEEGKEVF